ncbi:MAG TPA: IS66 family transposase [Thiotrichales bacterium]|nr:IS66 family transposase [Thiotrichales bacterium]
MQVTDCTAKNTASTEADSAAVIQALQAEVAALKQQLDWFKRQLFGRKSEKRLVDTPDQLDLSALLGETPPPAEPEPTEEITYTRRKSKRRREDDVTDTGLRFGPDVPIEVIELSAPQLKGPEADQYEVIDYKITRRLAQRPGSYVVLEYRRPVLRHKPGSHLMEVPAPSAVFEGSLADVSLLAGILVDKFCYHLPLYRQHQRLKDAGITLSRSTLTNYTQRAIGLLRPIVDAQWQHILQSRVLAMDETPIKAGRKKKGRMQATWYWPIYGEDDEICFTWSTSRGSAHIEQQLEGFEGVLLSDGYAAYDRYAKNKPRITQAQCWAHTRRYFERASQSDPAAEEALTLIGGLYRVEQQIRDKQLEGQAKLDYRSRHALPIADAFFGWCHQQRQRMDLVNSDPLAKALVYAENHQAQLKVYLGDPDVPIDTNHLERALRVIPMGRKNWLFCWSEVGAKHVGIIQSLLTTCRLHQVDPCTYLVDVLQRVALHPARDVIELTPRLWKERFAANPLRSDLDHAH